MPVGRISMTRTFEGCRQGGPFSMASNRCTLGQAVLLFTLPPYLEGASLHPLLDGP